MSAIEAGEHDLAQRNQHLYATLHTPSPPPKGRSHLPESRQTLMSPESHDLTPVSAAVIQTPRTGHTVTSFAAGTPPWTEVHSTVRPP